MAIEAQIPRVLLSAERAEVERDLLPALKVHDEISRLAGRLLVPSRRLLVRLEHRDRYTAISSVMVAIRRVGSRVSQDSFVKHDSSWPLCFRPRHLPPAPNLIDEGQDQSDNRGPSPGAGNYSS
jgi:hypothetical protein